MLLQRPARICLKDSHIAHRVRFNPCNASNCFISVEPQAARIAGVTPREVSPYYFRTTIDKSD